MAHDPDEVPIWLCTYNRATGPFAPEFFSSVDLLLQRLNALKNAYGDDPTFQVHMFSGKDQLYLSRGHNKRLIMPDGRSYPLVPVQESEIEIDYSGHLSDPD